MSKLDDILEFNKVFVDDKEYTKYTASKNPSKKILILSCMDTRLTDLLPKALNLKNGDAKIVKNAGASIMHPFGSIMRSIIVGIYEFDIEEIFVIGHYGCGMCNLNVDDLLEEIIKRGIPKESMGILSNSGIDVRKWLYGFGSVEDSINDSVNIIKNHPLMSKDVSVHGLAIDPETGKLDVIVNGYK